ncbi:MAG TPA: hypothetical protein VMW65_01010 [Chloroflexota bacterium]|nr:hypothetical protein [Chloroflexota bacterium]
MGLFDDPRDYYGEVGGYLRQGDLVLAPSTTLWSAAERPADPGALLPPSGVGVNQITLLWPRRAPVEGLAAEVRWGLVMVLPHECAIHRDFNRRLVQLEAEGMGEAEAIERASGDPALDPTIVVAPVIPLSSLPETDRRAVSSGGRIGLFPVCAGPAADAPLIPAGVVDLGRLAEISRRLVHRRVARLSERARAFLRFKLAEQWAYRNQSLDAEIAQAVGHTIMRHQVIERSKDLQVVLELDDGTTLVLKQDQRRPGRVDLPSRSDFPDRPVPRGSQSVDERTG